MPIKPLDVTVRGRNELKPAFDAAEKTMRSFADRGKALLAAPFTALNGIIAGLTVGAIGNFAKASVESAAAADAAWGRVETAVENAGITFSGVRADLDALFTKTQQTTRYSDDDAASAFANLVNISGDYAGSIKNLSLVTDLAAAKQIDLRTASDLVGKVMAGETGTLSRYGIVVKQGADAIQVMRDRFQGFAEKDAGTLQGRVQSIANAWDNVKEAIGRALTQQTSFDGASGSLSNTLNKLGTWIDENSENISGFASAVETAVTWLGKLAMYTVGSHGIGGLLGGYARLGEAAGLTYNVLMGRGTGEDPGGDAAYYAALEKVRERRHAKAVAQIEQNQEKVAAERAAEAAKAAAAAAKKRADAQAKQENALAANEAAATRFTMQGVSLGTLAGVGTPTIGANRIVGGATAAALPVVAGATRGFSNGARDSFEAAFGQGDPFAQVDTSLGSLQQHMESFTGGTLAGFFSTWQEGIGDVISGHESLGKAIVKSGRKAIGGVMASEGQATLLKAAAAAAEGFTNPIKFLQAGRLFAVGTAELGLAAALSGGGSGGGGGGVSSAGFAATQNDTASRGKTTIILPGTPVSFKDPDTLDALVEAFRELGNTGDIDVIVRGGATG